jgi:AICAR transformylase/IMP cyclohydrolase PurH
MANEQNLKPFKKGFDPDRNIKGRPKKYASLLKDSGYKLSEINDTIQNMMSMTLDELKEVFDNPAGTILEKTIANSMVKSLKKGSLYSLDTLLTRVYGKPKETANITQDGKIEVVFIMGKTIL